MAGTNPLWRRVWGGATALLDRANQISWVDLLAIVGLAGLLFGLLDLAREWFGSQPAGTPLDIDLGLLALPRYTFFSLCRGLLAFLVSLGFTLAYGYWAAKDRVAEKVLLPLLDVLQSIPVLGFLPGLYLALKNALPGNIGLELAAILLIFTGQAWNMTFSFYHSLRSIPLDQQEVARVYRFNLWQRFRWVELPYSTMGLVWNGMMSMAGGWFFLMICEDFQLGDEDFRLPGLGSYMSVAVNGGRVDAMIWAIVAMVLLIVGLDQFLWRPVVVWAQKFRVEEGGSQPVQSSWFLSWLRHSRLLPALGQLFQSWTGQRTASVSKGAPPAPDGTSPVRSSGQVISVVAFLLLVGGLIFGVWKLLETLPRVSLEDWSRIPLATGATLGRVLISTAVGTLWALPAGLAVGLSPRLSRIFQPIVQVVASFPAPMLFPLVIAGLNLAGVSLGWGSIVLMLLGTQWYIFFNVIAGAMGIPADLREAAHSYRITGWQRFRALYAPGVFPHLITGWVTAAGGAWNTSIVAEYVKYNQRTQTTIGLGALINEAADKGAKNNDYSLLIAAILVMAVVVVAFNRLVWRPLYLLAEERFSLNK